MSNSDYDDEEHVILNGVDDAVLPHPNPPQVVRSSQLLDPMGARSIGQRLNGSRHTKTISLVQRQQSPFRRRLHLDPIPRSTDAITRAQGGP